MKFLIDAQLPRRLANQFQQAGLEATHTLELPDGNRTTDQTFNTHVVGEPVCSRDEGFRFRAVVPFEERALEISAGINRQYWQR
jgi:predicted nuclease of predicted toxin-antitoxin system